MYHSFYYILACLMVLQVYANCIVSYKIDSTLLLINEELIASSVSHFSILEATEYNDISYLVIDQKVLIELVNSTLNDNLSFLTSEAKYYFYDKETRKSCPIGSNYCNSVQMKVTIIYQNKEYERILRYEPIKI